MCFLSAQTVIVSESFETWPIGSNSNNGWTVLNSSSENKWYVGVATSYPSSSRSIYISNDNGVSNAYTRSGQSTKSHFYTPVYIPDNATELNLQFDIRCNGEDGYDFVRVYLSPSANVPVAGTDNFSVSYPDSDSLVAWRIGATQYNSPSGNLPNATEYHTINIPITQSGEFSGIAGTTRNLVFTWVNDESTGRQSPASIDNISLTYIAAPPEPFPATLLTPVNFAEYILPTTTLTWESPIEGNMPTGYDLYLDTVNPPTTLYTLGNVTSWTPPSALAHDTQYWWQVRPRNANGTTDEATCEVWTFTTILAEPFPANLSFPPNNSESISTTPTFTWNANVMGNGPTGYDLYWGVSNPPMTVVSLNNVTSWAPATPLELETTYFWQIVPRNEHGFTSMALCPIWSFTTIAENEIVIGNISAFIDSQQYVPIYQFYQYSYSQTIYLASEIDRPTGDAITQLYWYYNGNSNFSTNISIWMGYTDNTEFVSDADWIPHNSLACVLDGELSMVAGTRNLRLTNTPGWVMVELDEPFNWHNSSGNLVVAVASIDDAVDWWGRNSFFYCNSSPQSYRSIMKARYENPFNLDNITDEQSEYHETLASFPVLRLLFEPPIDGASLSITPLEIDFGNNLLLLPVRPRGFTIRSNGTEDVIVNSVVLSGADSEQFSLVGAPATGQVISTGQTISVSVLHTPVGDEGVRSATIAITDNRPETTVIEVISNAYDTNIYDAYTQNFDDSVVAELPIGWGKIVYPQNRENEVNIEISNEYSYSVPNSIRFNNQWFTVWDGVAMIAHTPMVVDLNQFSMKFRAYTNSSGSSLEIGYLTDIADHTSFVFVENFYFEGLEWSEQQRVSFVTIPDGNYNIAFRHPQERSWIEWFIDDIIIERIPDGADFVSSVDSLSFGTIEQGFSISARPVIVSNIGNQPLTLYTVLPTGFTSNPPTAVENPVSIQPGGSLSITFTYSPDMTTLLGVYNDTIQIYTNALNANPTNIAVSGSVTSPPPENIVRLGFGAEVGRETGMTSVPINPNSRYSWSQTIYHWSEIAFQRPTGGAITSIGYEYTGSAWSQNVRIFMGHTDDSEFMGENASTYHSTEPMTLVYDGPWSVVAATSSGNWRNINLQTPFVWIPGQNIIVSVEEYSNGSSQNMGDAFYMQITPGQVRSVAMWTDGSPFNSHSNPSFAMVNPHRAFPNTRFSITPIDANISLVVAPSKISFGDIQVGLQTPPRQVRISNLGFYPIEITSISLGGYGGTATDTEYSLTGLSMLPITIQSGITNSLEFMLHHHPTTTGNKTAVLTVVDDENIPTRATHSIVISSNVVDHTISSFPYIQTFDTNVSPPLLPVGWGSLIDVVAGSGATVSTTTSDAPFSLPGHLAIENGSVTDGSIIAHTPPISDINTRRIVFRARSNSTNQSNLLVGTMSNPMDANTFHQMTSILVTNENAEYIVSFATANHNDNFIAFKHGLGTTPIIQYIDNVIIETIPTGASFNCSITSINFGSTLVNTPRTVIGLFRNSGGETLTMNISTPLYVSMDVANPVVIQPGNSVSILFTLSIPIPTAYSANINIITNAANAPTYTIPITAVSEYFFTWGVGNTTGNSLPWDPQWNATYSQSIYTTAELDGLQNGSTIQSLSYQYNGGSATSRQITIWMGWTTSSVFATSSAWLPISDMTPVFMGTHQMNAVSGWYTIDLDGDGFEYSPPTSAHNLVIATNVHVNTGSSVSGSFFTTATSGNRSLSARASASAVYNPTLPPFGTLRAALPNIRMGFIAPGPARPSSLSAIGGFSKVTLTWMAPVVPPNDSLAFENYTIYKNGVEFESGIIDTEYIDTEVYNGLTYSYYVVANYGTGVSSNPSNIVFVSPSGSHLDPPGFLVIRGSESAGSLHWNIGATVLYESFEESILPIGWKNIDADADGFKWSINRIDGKEGFGYICSPSFNENAEPLAPNNWLVSPEFYVPVNGTFLSYWIGASHTTDRYEKYQVMYSFPASENITDFVPLSEPMTIEEVGWVRKSHSLSMIEDSEMPVRIAIVHLPNVSQPRSSLRLDGISIVAPTSDVGLPDYDLVGYTVYRNGISIATQQVSTASLQVNHTSGKNHYWVTSIYNIGGEIVESSPSNVVSINVATNDFDEITPAYHNSLGANYPNPFNPSTVISFQVGGDIFQNTERMALHPVNISIYNVKGQKVRTLIDDMFPTGEHSVVWNGTDDSGKSVSSGVYFYRMNTDRYSATRKMILMK
jgi:hypothetical protein